MAVLYPPITWAERKQTAFITIELQNVSDMSLDLEETNLKFHGVSDGKTYECSLTFPDKIDKEQSRYLSTRHIQILLHKQEPKRWHKITTEPGKLHWIRCDWNQWLDTDDEEEQASGQRGGAPGGYGDMDFSQFGNLGQMNNMFGDEGYDGSGNSSDISSEEKGFPDGEEKSDEDIEEMGEDKTASEMAEDKMAPEINTETISDENVSTAKTEA